MAIVIFQIHDQTLVRTTVPSSVRTTVPSFVHADDVSVIRTDDETIVRTDDGTDDGTVFRTDDSSVCTDDRAVGGFVTAVTITITDHDQCFSSHDPRSEAEAHRSTIRVRPAGKEISQTKHSGRSSLRGWDGMIG